MKWDGLRDIDLLKQHRGFGFKFGLCSLHVCLCVSCWSYMSWESGA